MEQYPMCLPVSRCVIGLVSPLRPRKKKPLKGIDFQGLSNVVAVRTGLEPATPGVTGLYSNQLNYRTNLWKLYFLTAVQM